MARAGLSGSHANDARSTQLLAARWPASSAVFAQLEAAETIIFLTEARADFRQGIRVPRDEPSEERKAEGIPRLHTLRVQDGDRDRQDHRDGDAGSLEHPQQGQ